MKKYFKSFNYEQIGIVNKYFDDLRLNSAEAKYTRGVPELSIEK
jgi:hypothetical protein